MKLECSNFNLISRCVRRKARCRYPWCPGLERPSCCRASSCMLIRPPAAVRALVVSVMRVASTCVAWRRGYVVTVTEG